MRELTGLLDYAVRTARLLRKIGLADEQRSYSENIQSTSDQYTVRLVDLCRPLGTSKQGYSICGSTCGGIACGCFLPFPACTCLRIAHVSKKTQTVFEVVSCIEWQPVIQIDVDFMLYNEGKLKSFSLQPYATQKYDELSLTVISLQKPHSPLMDKRFAVTPMEAMMLPDQYQLPVECESEASALDAFVNCTNRMICSYENMKAPQTCQCPHDSLQNLRKEVSNVMPIRTPFTEIFSDSKEIYALSKQGEITLAIESNLLIGGTEFIINQPWNTLVPTKKQEKFALVDRSARATCKEFIT
ncbi:hypothetical protein RB195_022163 [Necator americanus]|uniref:Phlebovirus glycoprotein G2 fusion domain-containing protein n=1 Tax=Necator americanus TaxID=51031 RepID=A0ABR1EE89_NECAM